MTEFVTLADLHRDGRNLWAECQGCGKINQMMPWVLDGRVGVAGQYNPSMETKTIASILARLVCQRCGGREFDWRAVGRGPM